MKFIADLHIHSRFSRATAKNLDFENLYIAARLKGITVVATGDFTHPGWLSEIRENLVPAGAGLFRLREDLAAECEKRLNIPDNGPVRFILSTEISNIYKKNGATRKLHHLVFMPDIEAVERFNARLSDIGNLKSDGRPILGLDSRNLLEIALETTDESFLIPAHIWTPWFSLFGSKSGFDTIRECFEDLSPHIFAAETGLSSDPPMNWRVTDLDNITLVSNSDAHSPANLGREANLFNTELSYPAIREALETGNPEAFGGTLEFYPEEGKYHHDGHRKCGVNLSPQETIKHNGICPVCGHPMTLGVLYRVEQLARRPEGEKPPKTYPFYSIIPLAEILGEIVNTGPKSKKVEKALRAAIETLGPELSILHHLPVGEIDGAGIPLLAEAVHRMRDGRVHVTAGFDGEYGKVRIFTPDERDQLIGQRALFAMPSAKPAGKVKKRESTPLGKPAEKDSRKKKTATSPAANEGGTAGTGPLAGLNDAQRAAVQHGDGPLLIVAGPGTGKTRTLTCRIAAMMSGRNVPPDRILAVTFTQKAAREMEQRLLHMLDEATPLPLVATFHGFCFRMLQEIETDTDYTIVDDDDRRFLVREAMDRATARGIEIDANPDAVLDCVVAAKQQILSPVDDLEAVAGGISGRALGAVYAAYQQILDIEHLYDYEDLIYRFVRLLEADDDRRTAMGKRFPHIFIDEYQDLNYAQYRLVRALAPPHGNICVIGDPDQSIYGFRGSDPAYFKRFCEDFPGAVRIHLEQNYRSTETILTAAHQVICNHSIDEEFVRIHSGIHGDPHIFLLDAGSENGEAVAIGKTIERLVGGMGFHFHDFGRNNPGADHGERSFSDFAVLYRTRAQGDVIAAVFEQAGIPCQRVNKEQVLGQKGIREIVSALKLVCGCGAYIDLKRIAETSGFDMSRADFAALQSWGYQQGLTVNRLLTEVRQKAVGAALSADACRQLDALAAELDALSAPSSGRSVSEILDGLICRFGCPADQRSTKQAETIDMLQSMAKGYGTDAAGFLAALALRADPDFSDLVSEKVALMTLHAAKGLEFSVVFIAGCEDGLIPYRRSGRDSDISEERRLFYVGMTRARSRLYLCRAQQRRIYGKAERQATSPFLSDMDSRLMNIVKDDEFIKKPKQIQLDLF